MKVERVVGQLIERSQWTLLVTASSFTDDVSATPGSPHAVCVLAKDCRPTVSGPTDPELAAALRQGTGNRASARVGRTLEPTMTASVRWTLAVLAAIVVLIVALWRSVCTTIPPSGVGSFWCNSNRTWRVRAWAGLASCPTAVAGPEKLATWSWSAPGRFRCRRCARPGRQGGGPESVGLLVRAVRAGTAGRSPSTSGGSAMR